MDHHKINDLIRLKATAEEPSPQPAALELRPRLAQAIQEKFKPFRLTGEGWNREEQEFSSSAFCAMAEVAANMVMDNENGYMISLIGQTSVGKTLLMKCLRRFWNYHVPPKAYTSRADFHVATWIDWPSHKWEVVEDAKSARCLFLDEVGRGRNRDANGLDRLIDLLSYRENRGLWTGLTAQLSHKEFMELDPALGERLRRGRNVCFQAGNSIRPFHRRA